MEELIKFKNSLKDFDLEKLLDLLVKESKELEYLRDRREDLRNLSKNKILMLKLHILENYNNNVIEREDLL